MKGRQVKNHSLADILSGIARSTAVEVDMCQCSHPKKYHYQFLGKEDLQYHDGSKACVVRLFGNFDGCDCTGYLEK